MSQPRSPAWIFCAGMMRSGSTLQYQLAAELVERHALGRRLGYTQEADFPRVLHEVAGTPGRRVFKAHHCTEEMRQLFEQGCACGLYVYRDLRDVAVSLMHKYGFSFDVLWKLRWLDQLVVDEEIWTRLPDMLISRYETMATDIRGEVERIGRHLGIQSSPAECAELAAEHRLERQQQRAAQIVRCVPASGPSTLLLFDPHTLLHHDHIRSGASGTWRQAFTGAQTALFEDRFGPWLAAHHFG